MNLAGNLIQLKIIFFYLDINNRSVLASILLLSCTNYSISKMRGSVREYI